MPDPATSRPPVRIGVLGVGRIGAMHAELLARRVPGAALACVYDAHTPTAESVGAQLGVAVAPTVEAMMTNPEVDAVAICSSTETHVDLLIAAANAAKPIFCEKPVSLNLAEVDRALTVVEASGVAIQIGFNRRFDPSHRAVRDAVAEGKVGDVHIVRISSRDPAPPPISYIKVSGGIFLDMTVHDLDMARYVTASEVVSVFARGAVRIDPAIGEAGDLDTAVLVLEHENGAITTIDNSRQAVYGYDQRVEVFGSAGVVASENPYVTTTVLRDPSGSHHSTIPYFFIDRYIPSYLAEWEAFVGVVGEGKPSPVVANDGRAPLVIGLAALKSVKESRTVLISEISA